ncbi:hypothetical protein MACJ_001931 [Theileria orientalis]|uniref:RanBP2-type domain-containing protein n=1 Tax=Theileria orientalis TaxID=68886 RepID=A0A976M5A9_THEOR|nr:hypothetical protein MACJ_001931 [Theileria orientalis]
MANMWVCGTCLVKNEANHKSCVCCGISNPQAGSVGDKPSGDFLGQQKTNEILPFVQDSGSFSEEVEQYKVVNRIRMKFNHEDLKHTTLFMSGSGEMEQIPYVCLDRHVSPETNEVEPVYECSIPIPLKDLPTSRIKAVECGALHTAFLTSSGAVYTYGCNDMGALGRLPPKTTEVDGKKDPGETPIDPSNSDGLESWEREPGEVETKFKAKEISCGDNHTLILSISGEVYITGGFKDTSGPIGIADYTSIKGLKKVDYHTVPVKVPISEPIQSIASGENHCVCLAEGGKTIYTFGSNEFSQLIMSNDEVQNPTDTDIDVSVQENIKLLFTWPQLRRVSDIIKPPKVKSGDMPPRSGDENESHGKNGATTTTKVRQQSYNTRSMTNKKIVPSARRTRGNRNVKNSNTMSTEQSLTKRGRTVSEVITRIFTGNCTTFFQTKSLKLYGVGRNGQGEVGVGSEELIIEHPRELIFFRGVEITQIRGGQFFTASLVQKRVFVWGSVSYLGLPKEYDTRNCKLETGAPNPDDSNTHKGLEMADSEKYPFIDSSSLVPIELHSLNLETTNSPQNETILAGFFASQPQPSVQMQNPDGEEKMITIKISGPNPETGKQIKPRFFRISETMIRKIIAVKDYSCVPRKFMSQLPGDTEPKIMTMGVFACEFPPGFKFQEHELAPIKLGPSTYMTNVWTPKIEHVPIPVDPHQQAPTSVQTLPGEPEQLNPQDLRLIHRPFFHEAKGEVPAGDSHESNDPPVNPSGSKRRKLKGTQLTFEEPDGMERLIKFDYTRRCKNAFEFGKATEPILLPMVGPVNSIFTGSDATFAILFNDRLYSWGSSQNYILGNGKDQYFEETPQMVPSEHFPGFKVVGGAGGSQHTAFIAEKLDPLVMAQ